MDTGELTTPERLLWKRFAAGGPVDLRCGDVDLDDPGRGGDWGAGRTVRAAVIAALLLGGVRPEPGRVAGLRLAGARISGQLDLSYAGIDDPVEFEECSFEAGVVLTEATVRSLRLHRCRLPHLDAGGVEVRGHLDLVGSRLH